jgi:hypothetical protein
MHFLCTVCTDFVNQCIAYALKPKQHFLKPFNTASYEISAYTLQIRVKGGGVYFFVKNIGKNNTKNIKKTLIETLTIYIN